MTNWESLAVILLFGFLCYFYRFLIEERALRMPLGQPYVVYMHYTKRLIPFVF